MARSAKTQQILEAARDADESSVLVIAATRRHAHELMGRMLSLPGMEEGVVDEHTLTIEMPDKVIRFGTPQNPEQYQGITDKILIDHYAVQSHPDYKDLERLFELQERNENMNTESPDSP